MRISEEILLLLLSEDSGYFHPIPSWSLSCVTAGAILADLALDNRIDTDLQSLNLIDATATGDDALDSVLQEIASEKETRSTQYWVEKTAHRSESVIETLLDRLVGEGILDHDQAGYWSLSRSVARSGIYPSKNGAMRTEARARIRQTLFADEIPDPRDVILIGLANTCDALRYLMPIEDYEEVIERVELFTRMDLVSRTIGEAVRGICMQPPPMRFAATKEIPKLRLRDILGNKSARKCLRQGNIAKLMAEIYRMHGSVVEVNVPFSKQRMMILVGRDTNKWFHKQGRNYLRTKDYIWGLENLFGASRTLPGMDGAEHFRLRKALNRGYSRGALEYKLEELYLHCRSSLQDWKVGKSFNGTNACRSLMSRQVSHLILSVDTAEYIEDVMDYQHRALTVRAMHALPEIALHTPAMKRKRKLLEEVLGSIHSAHTPGLRMDQKTDLVDEYLRIHAEDPQFLPQTDLNFYFLAALIASIYLGSGLAFAVSTMSSHKEVYERIKAEADALFGKGNPSAKDFTPQAVDTAYRLHLETHRIFPVIPVQLRHVMNPCTVEGHEIAVGTRLVIAQTGSHFLEEHFPDPLQFDIDRFLPEREEKMELGVYAPFGLGTHKCLGSRWVDLQMVINILMIAHHFDLTSSPSSYDLKINPFPTSAPNKDFSIRVNEVRHQFPALDA